VKNLTFNNIKTQSPRLLRVTSISPQRPVENLTVSNVTGTAQVPIDIKNMKGVKLININLSGFEGEMVRSENVSELDTAQIKPSTAPAMQ
jgi:hypothetical protein